MSATTTSSWRHPLVDRRASASGSKPPVTPSRRGAMSARGSLSIGRIAGIDIRLHFTFLLFLGWVALSHFMEGHTWQAAAAGLLVIACLFAIIVLHELGHALVARRFGVRTFDITLLPIGGVGRLEHMPQRPLQELAIALAGPAVNLLIALLLWGVIALFHLPTAPTALRVVGGPLLAKLLWINVGLAVFNLIPAFPMDGGRVLRAALAIRVSRPRATAIAAGIGKFIAIGFGILGWLYNPILLLIALFVWFGAAQENAAVQLSSALSAVPIARVMLTAFETLSPSDSLADATERTLGGFQSHFPVVEGDRPVGMISRAQLMAGIAALGSGARVEEVMTRDLSVVNRNDSADRALEKLPADGGPVIVVDGPTIVGIVLPDHLAELFAVMKGPRASQAMP